MTFSSDAIDYSQGLLGPSLAHPFGTDDLGRDLLARALLGGRVSTAVGVVAVLIAITLGTFVGRGREPGMDGSPRQPDIPVKPQLGLWDAVSIIVGIVIGSSIYKTPPLIFNNVHSPWEGLGVWAVRSWEHSLTTLVTLVGAWAVCYGVGEIFAAFSLRLAAKRTERLVG